MINKEFLSQCTDEQINKGVAWLEAEKLSIHGRYSWTTRLLTNPPKYCTNPNDAWPIMMANNIVIVPSDGDPRAVGKNLSKECLAVWVDSNDELLRAAMEVYILMMVEK